MSSKKYENKKMKNGCRAYAMKAMVYADVIRWDEGDGSVDVEFQMRAGLSHAFLKWTKTLLCSQAAKRRRVPLVEPVRRREC